jgi:hypothetical protein
MPSIYFHIYIKQVVCIFIIIHLLSLSSKLSACQRSIFIPNRLFFCIQNIIILSFIYSCLAYVWQNYVCS